MTGVNSIEGVNFMTSYRFDIKSLNIGGEEDGKGIADSSAQCRLLSFDLIVI